MLADSQWNHPVEFVQIFIFIIILLYGKERESMVWSFRRSVKFGPVSVNFSKSGIGTSLGIKGARVSVGPRGTCVSVRRGGIYYRQKIGGQTKYIETKEKLPQPKDYIFEEHLQEIETVGAEQLIDSSSEQLLNEINEKHRMPECFSGEVGYLFV